MTITSFCITGLLSYTEDVTSSDDSITLTCVATLIDGVEITSTWSKDTTVNIAATSAGPGGNYGNN